MKILISFLTAFLMLSINCTQANVVWDLQDSSEIEAQVREALKSGIETDDVIYQPIIKIDISVDQGTITKHVQKAWYFPTIESTQNFGTDFISFDEIEEDVRVLNVKTIRPDMQEIGFNSNSAQILDTDSYNVFTSEKNILIPFAGLRVGSVAILEYVIVSPVENREVDWSQSFYPQNFYPRGEYHLNVDWEDKDRISWANTSSFATCQNQNNNLSCFASSIPAVEDDAEVFWADELGVIRLSELAEWDDLITPVLGYFNQSSSSSGDLKNLVDQVVGGLPTTEEKISAILQYVAQDIRYVSASESGHAYTPHSFEETTTHLYGDCKDKSVVLATLLSQIGIDAYPVLVSTERNSLSKLNTPAYDYFNHMVVCFEYGENEYCLDATDSYTNWQTISPWIQGRVALDLIPGSEPRNLPNNPHQWELHVTTKATITEAGGLIETQRRTYRNEYAGAWRGILSGMTAKERDEVLTDHYHETIADGVDPVFEIIGLFDLDGDLHIDSVTEFEPFLSVEANIEYFDYDFWLRDELESFHLTNDTYDSIFTGLKVRSSYEINMGSHWRVDGQGADLAFEQQFGSYNRSAEIIGQDTVIYTSDLALPAANVPANEVEDFNQFLSILSDQSIVWGYGKLLRK